MLRALQIFATLDEAWDSFKCGDYEAGAEVCGHIVGIDARPLISRQHSSRAPVTAINCRFQLHMSRPADDKSRPWNELFFFASRASR